MELPIVTKKYFSGGMSGGNISVSYWYEASTKDGRQKGGVGLFVSISGPEDFAGERSAKFMWDGYLEEYLYTVGKVGDVLRKSVKAAQQRLVDLLKNESGVSEQGVDVHVCAIAVVDGTVSIILMGEPGVVLIREGKVIDLAEMVPSFSGQGLREEISVGTFGLRSKDTLMISTPKLVQSLLGTFEDGGEETLGDWAKINKAVEQFSANLVGNQYLWTVGCDVPEEEFQPETLGESAEEIAEGDDERVVADERIDEHGEVEYTQEGIRASLGEGLSGESKSRTTAIGLGMVPRLKNLFRNVSKRLNSSALKEVLARMRKPEFLLMVKRAIGAKVSALRFRRISQKRMVIGQEGGLFTRFMKSKVALLLVFLVLLGCIGLYILKQAEERKRIAEFDASLASIEADIEKAQLDWEADQDRPSAIGALTSLSNRLSAIKSESLQPDQVKKKDVLKDNWQAVSDSIDRITPIMESNGTIEILTDLYLKIGENTEVTDFEKYGTDLFLVDKTSHAVYRYSPGQDTVKKVANSGEILKSPLYITIGITSDFLAYLFVFDSEVGVVMLDMNVNEPEWTFKIRPELSARTIGEVTEIAGFMENIYILKRDEARVLKSYPSGAGYGFPEDYFRNGGFDKAVDIVIDGNIYVLSNSSEKVYKYFGGEQDSFSISGLNEPLGKLCCGASNMNDTGKLYLYDETNTRIISLEKPTNDKHPGIGVLVKQYVYRGDREDLFTDVKDIVIDIDERVMYVLDGTRLLQVSLDHD